MKQDINLLLTPAGSTSRHPTARQAAMALLLVFTAGFAGGSWYDYQLNSLQKQVATLNSSIDDLVFNLEERSHFLAQRNADPSLVAELQRRQREADDKSRVLDLLSGESVGNTDGFSGHLAALGRRHPEGLWLERIRISDGGRQLLLRGLALDAGLIPKFLGDLQLEPVLAGTTFSTFALSSDEERPAPLRFALATGCESNALNPGESPCVPDADQEAQP